MGLLDVTELGTVVREEFKALERVQMNKSPGPEGKQREIQTPLLGVIRSSVLSSMQVEEDTGVGAQQQR